MKFKSLLNVSVVCLLATVGCKKSDPVAPTLSSSPASPSKPNDYRQLKGQVGSSNSNYGNFTANSANYGYSNKSDNSVGSSTSHSRSGYNNNQHSGGTGFFNTLNGVVKEQVLNEATKIIKDNLTEDNFNTLVEGVKDGVGEAYSAFTEDTTEQNVEDEVSEEAAAGELGKKPVKSKSFFGKAKNLIKIKPSKK